MLDSPALIHRNKQTQGITTIIPLLYWIVEIIILLPFGCRHL